MLKTLYIENIAVIEKTSIDFSEGLNVLTGETGAGKSIIIDAINAILGQRTSKEIIRTGANSAFVSATFEDVNKTAAKKLGELGFDLEDDVVRIKKSALPLILLSVKQRNFYRKLNEKLKEREF